MKAILTNKGEKAQGLRIIKKIKEKSTDKQRRLRRNDQLGKEKSRSVLSEKIVKKTVKDRELSIVLSVADILCRVKTEN